MPNHTVIKKFRDKEDNKKIYNQGDLYRHEDAERVTFLIDKGFLDEKEVENEFPKHTGGGWFELSNGEKIKGKDEAVAAEKEIENRGE